MSRKILIVDDSLTIRKVVELTFLGSAWEVAGAAGTSEARPRLSEEDLDVVIADVHVPDGDGYEICERSKREAPDRPVVLLVGTFESLDEARAESCGADAVLRKPFDSQELLRLVERLTGAGVTEPEEDEEPEAEGEEQTVVQGTFGAPSESPWPPVAPHAAEQREDEEEGETVADEPEETTRPGIPTPADRPAASGQAAEEDDDQATATTGEVASAPSVTADEGDVAEGARTLSDAEVDRIARRVVELLSADEVRRVAWEVVPDLAEVVVRERLEELEGELEEA